MHGHTHTQYYELVQSYSNPGTPIMLANVAGGVTTYTEMNPSFMTIDFDAETMLPINMSTFYMDFEKANADGYPTWEKLYDMKTEYGLADLSPKSMLELSERILNDTETANQFNWNMVRRYGDQSMDADQLLLYCMTSTSEMHERHDCEVNAG